MKCPHCIEGFHANWSNELYIENGLDQYGTHTQFWIRNCICPTCEKKIIQLGQRPAYYPGVEIEWEYIFPKAIARSPLPKEVDDETLIKTYTQSCLVLADSAMASAALSRRCLQHILREKAGVKPVDLSTEIDEVIESNKLPSDLSGDLDAVRNIGNFAAHPMKSTNSGEIFDVEPGEAEWNLDVVEGLMDYYFVRPARSREKKVALNAKLKEAGKPELPL